MIRRPPRSTLFPYTTPLPIYARARQLARPRFSRPLQHPYDPAYGAARLLPLGAHDELRHVRRDRPTATAIGARARSEEHTSELQSRQYLVCRLLLEKKKTITL